MRDAAPGKATTGVVAHENSKRAKGSGGADDANTRSEAAAEARAL
jgi:hypothetical protein